MRAGRRIPTVLVAISAAAVLLAPAAPAAAQGVLLDVTVTSQPDALNIFVKTSTEPKRSEEHTSELQSQSNLVCRLLLEKKKKQNSTANGSIRTPFGRCISSTTSV